MAPQSAIFVDAGFLLAVGGLSQAQTSLRSAFDVDHQKLISGIKARAEEFCGLETLRMYWYDAAKDAVLSEQHKKIGMVSGVKVRLGRLSYGGDQKGVDLKLGLDLVGIARNRAARVVFLVSGDDDLAEAVEAAQELGVKVVLIGIEDPFHRLGVRSVAEHLALTVDSVITLPMELIESCFKSKPAASRPAPPADTQPPGQAPLPGPKPGVMGRPVPGPPHHAVVPASGLHAAPQPATLHRVRGIESGIVYSSGPASAVEESAILVAQEVGERLAVNWHGAATQGELNDLLADKPLLPPELDRVLLKDCAQRIGEQKTDLQGVRRMLRESFWRKMEELKY
ncbi:NYN domain-containing protein [Arthrobacter cavernae]|uniref:NYN domain-containing protein n=1 Tax=Arthrobacter cavernae TaxID=2817681 RepID=A0A939HCH6_9MICC|nr:NYN domain-containing protein [Arthrobacter cavernae]MBO1267306.1 NYN domain-containing protein [Arthrobacter cavernae]